MPTILRVGPYRFFFFSNEGNEPVHIHVEAGDGHSKFWVNPVQLAKSSGFNAREVNEMRKLVLEHSTLFMEKWNEYFGS